MKTQSLRTTVLVMLALLAGPAGAMSQEATGRRTHSAEVRTQVDETLVWNQVMLDAIVASTLGNPQTIRMAATVNTAMFDAQNGVGRPTYRPIFVTDRAPRGTHRRAAIVQAAYVTLDIVLSRAAEPVRRAAHFVSRRVRRRRLRPSRPTRPRVGRARREPNPGLARDRRLQRPRTPVYRCRCSRWPVGVRNRYQHVAGQPRLHSPFRADQQHPVPVRLSAALDDTPRSGICRGLQ